MKVLVMGGNRYIGLQLVHELIEQGHDVTVLNSHETSWYFNLFYLIAGIFIFLPLCIGINSVSDSFKGRILLS